MRSQKESTQLSIPSQQIAARFRLRLVCVAVPGEADQNTVITKVGDTWRSWGWYVFERDGFNKPNQFGYAPDGYRLQIEASNPTHPPTLQGSTPCFHGDIARDDVNYPAQLTADG